MSREPVRPIRWWSIALFLAVTVSLGAWLASGRRDAPPPRPTVNQAFRSAPVPDGSAVVWAVGDGADGSTAARRVAARIAADRPERVLYLGDVYEQELPRSSETTSPRSTETSAARWHPRQVTTTGRLIEAATTLLAIDHRHPDATLVRVRSRGMAGSEPQQRDAGRHETAALAVEATPTHQRVVHDGVLAPAPLQRGQARRSGRRRPLMGCHARSSIDRAQRPRP